jgi:hypothetical protein
MKLKGIEIKPGMVIASKSAKYVAFPLYGSCPSLAFANITKGGWTTDISSNVIKEIHNPPTTGVIDSGELLWAEKWNREITMDEIAEKFGIPVKQLRIKKE